MADEEPKTPVSPSGLYDTSYLGSLTTRSVLSDGSLSGLGEFTFMCWVYPVSAGGNITIYRESSSSSLEPLYFLASGSVSVSFDNSNGGTTTLQYPYTREVNEWHHWTVTGSVSNGRLRLYKDGVLVQSAVMAYANGTSSLSRIYDYNYGLSQLNIYNRELSESEVAEHYVYDNNTMTSGVLGYDAMTPAQKSGLIYSSSFTKDISRSGNEFTDKSGSNITLSPQPTLTGAQIYIYTDANDLPSTSTTSITYRIHDRNSTYPPNATITNATELTYDSDTAGTCETFTIVHVSKSDIDGKKLYWSSDLTSDTSSAIVRGLSIYDGHLSSTDPTIFINGSPANGNTLIGNVLDSYTLSQVGIKSTSNNIPDLSSYGDDISFIVYSKDSWTGTAIVFDLFDLELREQNETVITDYDILGTIAEAGTDGNSSYGTIGSPTT